MAFPGGDVMLVKIGSATNSCQQSNRAAKSPGRDPCTELERRAGHLAVRGRPGRARRSRTAAAGRRGSGTPRRSACSRARARCGPRFTGAISWAQNWGFSDEANANNPAEELVQVSEGDDIGWPYCYYSNDAKRKVLAPEYGGDGKTVGRCATAKAPAIAFPGHWAPMALQFYPGRPVRARRTRAGCSSPSTGAGTARRCRRRATAWCSRRSPTASPWARTRPSPRIKGERFRPVGLAVGKDGALFVSDDENGTIWRIVKR